jgi:hypothetical protein
VAPAHDDHGQDGALAEFIFPLLLVPGPLTRRSIDHWAGRQFAR